MTVNPNETSLPSAHYWAASPAEDLPQVIKAKAIKYRMRLQRDGRLDLWRRAERTYYGQDATGGMANSNAVSFGGEAGEQILIRVNQFASMIKALLATAITKRLSYSPLATNNDAESAQQVTLAQSLLESYTRTCDLEGLRMNKARMAVLFGEGYEAIRWNPFIGKPLTVEQVPALDQYGRPKMEEVEAPDEEETSSDPYREPAVRKVMQPVMEEKMVREGDLEVHCFTPLEVIHDLDRVQTDLDWAILPYRENVWNLAARYPEHREKLLSFRGSNEQRWPRSAWNGGIWEDNKLDPDTDIVTVWWLYHIPCDALPEGRHAIVVGDVLVYDGAMDLPEVPVYPLLAEQEVSIARGHTATFDLLALQEAYDMIVDAELSMIDSFGTMSIIVPKGTDISPEVIGKGLQLIEYTADAGGGASAKPESLNLLEISPEVEKMRESILRMMETLSGINSVVRGDPLPQLKSGAALALVQSLAVAFNSAFQGAVVRSDERLATGILNILKIFAVNERNVEIAGKSNKGAMLAWNRDKLSTIERVQVEVGSPLQNSEAGKLEIAQQLLTSGFVKSPQEYIEVLTTGRLEPLYHGDKAETDLIARENEALSNLQPVTVVLTDDHALHVTEHKAVLALDHIRFDQNARNQVMKHIQEHTDTWLKMGQELSILTKQSIQSPPPPVPPQTGPNNGPPPKGLQDAQPSPNKAQPLGHQAITPGMPSMPKVAGTDVKVPNPTPQ